MYIVKCKRTGETITYDDLLGAEMFVKVAVMATNERIKRGIEKGKFDSKRNYEIIKA